MKPPQGQPGQVYKTLLFGILAVWLVVGFGRGMFLEHQQRQQCIEDYGWLRGWQFCPDEWKKPFWFNQARGYLWPIELFRSAPRVDVVESSTPGDFNKEEKTKFVATVFTCMAIARDTERTVDSNVFGMLISALEATESDWSQREAEYLGSGMALLMEKTVKAETETFYSDQCVGLASWVRESLEEAEE